jgi:glycosyltransferase involved in cell wall biosynthesis
MYERLSLGEATIAEKNMKILLCHNFYSQRSGEDIAFEYAHEHLVKAGHEVILYTRENSIFSQSTWFQLFMASLQVVYSPASRRQVYELAKKEQPHVAVVQNVFPLLSPSIYLGLAAAGVPVVQMVFNYRLVCANGQLYTHGKVCERCMGGNTLHGVRLRCFRQSYAASFVYSIAILVHRLLGTWRNHVKYFVVPDEFLGRKLASAHLPAEKMRKVVNAFRYEDYEPNNMRGDYLLFVGRLIRAKGIYTLLDACLLVPECRVLIVGEGEELEGIRRHEAVMEGKASLVGGVYGNELRELLRGCSAVLVPSEWYDNLPMIVCQALSSGKPVIASDINGIPEFVKHEKNGLLFPPGNPKALAAAINRLLGDDSLYQSLSIAARQSAEALFQARNWCDEMNAVLRDAVVAGKSGRV